MRFVLNELAGLDEVAKLPGYEDATPDTVDAILEEAAKFASEVLDPINYLWRPGRLQVEGRRGHARPKGFKEAYQQFVRRRLERAAVRPGVRRAGPAASWSPPPVEEMWTLARTCRFSLCPMLTQGAIQALELCGSRRAEAESTCRR